MKKILILTTVLYSSFSMAYTFNDLKGTYDVTAKDIPVMNVVTIKANGDIKIVEVTYEADLICKGKATLKDDQLESKVKCEDGKSYTQRINLKGVKSLRRFKAKVYSDLFQQEIEMMFDKIR